MALSVSQDQSVTRVAWPDISTILLDMDGTLLDLQFDNEFWLQTVPKEYARRQSIPLEDARSQLAALFTREAGKLNWYCLDFWSDTLRFDVAGLKQEVSHGVNWRPEAETFLAKLKASHCDVVLITNAHPETLRIKLERVNLAPWFDRIVSSHQFRAPKESPVFWQSLQDFHPFDATRTLFIDDSEAVLAAAARYGVNHLITLRQPDSTRPPLTETRFPAIHHFDEIYAGLDS